MVQSFGDLLGVAFESGHYLLGGVIEHHGGLVVTTSDDAVRIVELDVHGGDAGDTGRVQTLQLDVNGQPLGLLILRRRLNAYDMGRLASVAFDVVDCCQVLWRLFALLLSHLRQFSRLLGELNKNPS